MEKSKQKISFDQLKRLINESISQDLFEACKVYNECILQNNMFINDSILSEADDTDERQKVIKMIDLDKWERDDYDSFIKSLTTNNNSHSAFLTMYTPEDLEKDHVRTFKLKGYNIGFALKDTDDGNVDIISVHNNSNIRGIVKNLLNAAIRNGGTQLDHFDGKLSEFYSAAGFDEYNRLKFDRKYAPKDWNYDRDGEPDVIFRRLTNKEKK